MSSIGILGAGYVGETLARRLAPLGHSVKIANSRAPETLDRLTSIDGIHPVWAPDVLDDIDIAILALSQTSVAALGLQLADELAAVPIVIDSGNYDSPRDGDIAELLDGKPTTQWLSEQLRRSLYKAFNNIEAHWIAGGGRAAQDPERFALPVSGPEGPNCARVETLIDQLGYDPVYNGELSESWRQQPGTKCYCTNLAEPELRAALAEATLEQTFESNRVLYFTSNPSAIMRNQVLTLREYFGEDFGDPKNNAIHLNEAGGVK